LDRANLLAWRRSIEEAVRAMTPSFLDRHRYPMGTNVINDPDEEGSAALEACGPSIPIALLRFYTVIGEVSLPDVGKGWFVASAANVARAHEINDLRRVTGRHSADVVAFGSDGGGTRYALASPPDTAVYRLPLKSPCRAGQRSPWLAHLGEGSGPQQSG
jgi:hypothetical protein